MKTQAAAQGRLLGPVAMAMWSLVLACCGGATEVEGTRSDAGTGGDATTSGDAPAATDTAADSTAEAAPLDCPLPPGDYASCTSNDDCTFVSAGCYCGPQPVYGVSKSMAGAVAACETEAAQGCMLGCMNEPWQVTDEGQETADGGAVKVHCVPWDGGANSCKTYLE